MPSIDFSAFDAAVDHQSEQFLQELIAYCRQPAIAAQGKGMQETAQLVTDLLHESGAEAEIVPSAGFPAVIGSVGIGRKSLLVYNHYDVQPAEPLELWDSPPFEPTLREGKLYARGVADNRAHLLARLQAIRLYQQVIGTLPLQIKFLIEGEEEIGSVHLHQIAEAHRQQLKADGCIWETGGFDGHERPTVDGGSRGLLYVQYHVRVSAHDAHSANAGIFPNAAWRLQEALSTMRREGRTYLDGLAEQVRGASAAERSYLASLDWPEEVIKQQIGIEALNHGLTGVDAVEEMLYQPTANICGFWSGYTGSGTKTVIPCQAWAKMDFRLVPNLTAEGVLTLLRAHPDRRGFSDIDIEVLGAEDPAHTPLDAPIIQTAIATWQELMPERSPVVWPWSAGTGPHAVVVDYLGVPTVGTSGAGYWGGSAHAPNEHVRMADYYLAIKYFGRFLHNWAMS